MSDHGKWDVSADVPPAGFSNPLKALWWLKKGGLKLGPEWENAHNICQSAEGDADHDWIHALCHLIENDLGNAAYWFRRAGKSDQIGDVSILWDEIAAELA